MSFFSSQPARHRPSMALLALAALYLTAEALPPQSPPPEWRRRDRWQRPSEVMDALGIKTGSVVADVGCGGGYFTFHLASRVGPKGKVYAEDVDPKVLSKIHTRAFKEHLDQVELIQGTSNDPGLPAGALDAVLVVNAYHEMHEYDPMLEAINRALKPGGLLAVIDKPAKPGQPRSAYYDDHRIPAALVREDVTRHGFRFVREPRGFESGVGGKKYYFLIFGKP